MRIAVAMSGGVDSSVAAAILKDQGHEVFGITMQTWAFGQPESAIMAASHDAAKVCERLGIRHYSQNYRERFMAQVVEPFVDDYVNGRTPNPCARCNVRLKFGKLLDDARELGADALATGHYARLIADEADGKKRLLRGLDAGKDQSYFLFGLSHPTTQRIVFPLGEMSKPDVRKQAESLGFENADQQDSQDVCFIANGHFSALVASSDKGAAIGPGEIADMDGKILGRHDGFFRYTIGQRRGLGVAAAERLFVVAIDPQENRVVLGPKDVLFQHNMVVEALSLVRAERLSDGQTVTCKIRSRSKDAPATLHAIDDGPLTTGARLRVHFETAQNAITPGQAAVFYAGDEVLGGGWIAKAGMP